KRWPAWEIDYDDIMATPRPAWGGAADISIKEDGLTRVALDIERKTEASVVRMTVSLASGGASERVEFDTRIDWYERETLLKVCVPTTTANDSAWYDLGLGAIKRGLNRDSLYEVPGHQWADLTSPDEVYGVALLNDCRYGWDHPTPDKLRLTLVHTPGISEGWDWVADERSQDNGHHELLFAVQGHTGDWREGEVVWQAARLNQPLLAFQTFAAGGKLGKTYSLLKVTDDNTTDPASPGVMVNAVKMAEQSDEIVVRLRELYGRAHNQVALAFDRAVKTAREVNGSEEEIGPAQIKDGQLVCSLTPFQPKAFAVTLEDPNVSLKGPVAVCLDLPYNIDGISVDADRCDGDFDGHGFSLVGELIPDTQTYCDIPFTFGPVTAGALNVVKCEGQTIALPAGKHDRVCLLAASVDGPATVQFDIDGRAHKVSLQDYAEPIGQWNNRLSDGELRENSEDIAPAYINRLPVAWYGPHRHTPECENEAYRFTYAFLLEFDLPENAKTLTLPSDSRVRILSATLVDNPYGETAPAQQLYDEADGLIVRIAADSSAFAGRATISMSSPIPNTAIRYTVDGSAPTLTSAHYTQPITVASTSTIRACGVRDGATGDYVASKTVSKLTLHDPYEVGKVTGGLTCKYYEGEWSNLPDFDTLAVVSTFVADTVAIPEMARDEDYGLTFQGYVKVPADGVYAFSISSDDGSRLKVGDTLLVDNDGLHGDYEMTGLIGLKAGYYPITAHMFQCKGGEALSMLIAGPTLPKQPIPAGMLFHTEE
ncbi:MAG: chitobiase/beta-hexosaminidase C-terminal domain-containing protein, partial [candidate division Zixibacteria bacterium]|nr:chitobiase/beta-hexosaminidase C-terminal domain-containing protein [candidate division Zixibacteria bacterium]